MKQTEAARLLGVYFASWYSPLVRYAASLTGVLELAEDLVQEVFLRLYGEMRKGKTIEMPKAWMLCVLRHEIGKQARGRRKAAVSLDWIDPSDRDSLTQLAAPDSAGLGEASIEPDDVTRLFAVLTIREQEVMLLRMAALKYREIAERLGISPNSVNTLLARAVRKFRRAARKMDISYDDVARNLPKTLH